jgi:hypothetical protein
MALTEYTINNNNKKNERNKIAEYINKDPISKIQSYDAIKIETERLLKREQTFFVINSIVTVGLFITLFNVI